MTNSRPSGNRGRPPGRIGRGGVGPPAGAKTGNTGKGTNHKATKAAKTKTTKAAPASTGGCKCPMAAAARSVKRGKFRLAARYAAWSVRLIAAGVA